jgi:hypothetical protein
VCLGHSIQLTCFYIDDRCPSEKSDSELHSIFNLVNEQENQHFTKESTIKNNIFDFLKVATYSYFGLTDVLLSSDPLHSCDLKKKKASFFFLC